ncbi:MAG TPA: hypothetical protein VGM10_01050 [Actinocrinis sp.]|jgi:hypothetical protein
MRIFELLAGIALVVATWISLIATVVMPRGLRSRHTRAVRDLVRLPFQAYANRVRTYEAKDRVLAWAAPVSILATLLSWLGLFVVGFGLMLDGLSGLGLVDSLRESGSSVFTLGFASGVRARLTFVDFCAAASGPLAIALQIGYLPALYGAYARRESEVTLLQSRAGSPPWGPAILMRHVQIRGLIEGLPGLYRGWERWAAEISESHTNYPVLIHFRSPRSNRNWLIALLAVMDAAALELSLNPRTPNPDVRLALRAGFTCLRDIADVERIPYDPDPDPDGPIELTFEEFAEGISRLSFFGYPMQNTAEEAWPHFRGWRVNYEPTAYALAYRIDAVPAQWSGPRRTPSLQIDVQTPVDRKPADAETDGTGDALSDKAPVGGPG